MCWPVLACLLLLALIGLWSPQAQAVDSPDIIERRIKAAYLYKFGGYVEWPQQVFASPSSPLTIGVIGADALADELAQIVVGRTINGRPVVVRKLSREDPVAGLNVLFIGRSNNDHLAEILATTKGRPLLTVTESAEALAIGSMINFVVVNDKVRFEAAPKVAGQGNLSISARLLPAAYRVVVP